MWWRGGKKWKSYRAKRKGPQPESVRNLPPTGTYLCTNSSVTCPQNKVPYCQSATTFGMCGVNFINLPPQLTLFNVASTEDSYIVYMARTPRGPGLCECAAALDSAARPKMGNSVLLRWGLSYHSCFLADSPRG